MLFALGAAVLMAKNRIFDEGDVLSVVVPEGTVSGTPLVIGQIPCVATTDRRADTTASVDRDGVFKLKVEGKNKAGNKKIEIGDIIFIKAGVLNVNNEEGVRFGYALEVVEAGAATEIRVVIGY
jgi:predicted RecA/RadA family phage recombinase